MTHAEVAEDSPGGATILLVEDEPAVRSLARRVLERAGYRVLEAANADDALALFAENGPGVDLLLADVVLPGMTGPALAGEIRRRIPRLPVVFMSGYDEDELARRGISPGQIEFPAKPWSHEDLLDAVGACLRQADGGPGVNA